MGCFVCNIQMVAPLAALDIQILQRANGVGYRWTSGVNDFLHARAELLIFPCIHVWFVITFFVFIPDIVVCALQQKQFV